ncbi:putative toxin-antitoxin system toxin component, PIN family [Parafilimonas sp.]|uniref:putative toxin-antitoxin system toxin component, PIN family n=1 Tax=Parafilimonas sp. TaxID=1969739 RepID=UPI0039E214BF
MRNSFFVIDTNTLISAFLSQQSKPMLAYEKTKQIGKLSASIETYNEFCDTFIRDKFDKYISLETRLDILEGYREIAVFSEISETITACRDPKDNKFLELAIATNASCIITGDKDLLELNPFRGIPILNAADFLNMF